jgi:hypothetical protein
MTTSGSNPFGDHDDIGADENPYAATAVGSGFEDPTDMSDVARVRRAHIGHEASIRSIGLLYYIGSAICLAVGFPFLFAARTRADVITSVGFVFPVGVALIVLGFGLRGLRPWVRPFTILASVIGLMGLPVGTLISAYVLYLMLSAKGRLVLSPHYEDIVKSTPQITYRTSMIVWIFLGLLLVVLAMGMLAIFMVG